MRLENKMAMAMRVLEFYETFNIPVGNPDRLKLRVDLFDEELNELNDAVLAKDPVEIMDAIVDMWYVYLGTDIEFEELDLTLVMAQILEKQHKVLEAVSDKYLADEEAVEVFMKCFAEVHRSNMTKCSKQPLPEKYALNIVYNEHFDCYYYVDFNGKIKKPDCYEKPQIAKIMGFV